LCRGRPQKQLARSDLQRNSIEDAGALPSGLSGFRQLDVPSKTEKAAAREFLTIKECTYFFLLVPVEFEPLVKRSYHFITKEPAASSSLPTYWAFVSSKS
jgi:hypothetical protein